MPSPRRTSWLFRCTKWTCTILAGLMVVAWVGSRWQGVRLDLNDGSRALMVRSDWGAIWGYVIQHKGVVDKYFRRNRLSWEGPYSDIVAVPDRAWRWKPKLDTRDPRLIEFLLPLWLPTLVFAVPAAWMWRVDVKRRRAAREGCCATCGYSLVGTPADKPCPECGTSAGVRPARRCVVPSCMSSPTPRRTSRLFRCTKWACTILTCVVIVIWAGSRWVGFDWYVELGRFRSHMILGRGVHIFTLARANAAMPKAPMSHWSWLSRVETRAMGNPWSWRPELQTGLPYGTLVALPAWLPTLVFAVPAAWMWRVDVKRRRAAREGCCAKCGYSLVGTPADKSCPECGTARA
jgi:hypothetical protein